MGRTGWKRSLCISGVLTFLYPTACLANQHKTGEVDSMCRKVPVIIEETCYKDVVEKEPYICHGELQCVEEPVQVQATCHRPVSKKEAYNCPKTEHKQVCQKEPVTKEEMCYRHSTQSKPYACEKTKEICIDVTLDVPSTCAKHTKKKEAYECATRCERVPVESICKKTVEKPFSCTKTEYNEVCADVVAHVDRNCEKEWSEEAYDCSTVEYKTDCSVGSKLYAGGSIPSKRPKNASHFRKLNQTGAPHNMLSAHEAMKSDRRGRGAHIRLHEHMKEDVVRGGRKAAAMAHEHMKVDLHKGSNRGRAMMKGGRGDRMGMWKEHEMRKAETMRGRGGLINHEQMKTEMRERMRGKTHAPRKSCRQVPVTISKTCYRKVPTHQGGHCKKIVQHATKCKKVPVQVESTCYKSVTVDAKCVSHVEKCENSKTCYRDVAHVEHYECTKPETSRKCSLKKANGTCYRDKQVKESYDCSKTSYMERCENVPMVTEHTCYRTSSGHEEYACNKTEIKKKCSHGSGTCYRNRTVKQAHDCSRTEYKMECGSVVAHEPHFKHEFVESRVDRFDVGVAGSHMEKTKARLTGGGSAVRHHIDEKRNGVAYQGRSAVRHHIDEKRDGVAHQGRKRLDEKVHGHVIGRGNRLSEHPEWEMDSFSGGVSLPDSLHSHPSLSTAVTQEYTMGHGHVDDRQSLNEVEESHVIDKGQKRQRISRAARRKRNVRK
eukprot:GHVS01065255.1.p1 GENE.GHVS01065255.1~~GHVS01065255.1.p1  ORF type:complete len:792 (+),score=63.18 GHVS01065255.1:231-2378(+)